MQLRTRSFSMRSVLMLTGILVFLSVTLLILIVSSYMRQVDRDVEQGYNTISDEYVTTIREEMNNFSLAMEILALNQTMRENIFRTDVSLQEMMTLGTSLGKVVDSTTFFLFQDIPAYGHYFFTNLPGDGRYFVDKPRSLNRPWYQELQSASKSLSYVYAPVTQSNHLILAATINDFGTGSSQVPQIGYQEIIVDLQLLYATPPALFSKNNVKLLVFHDTTGELLYSSASLPDAISAVLLSEIQAEGKPSANTLTQLSPETNLVPIVRSIDSLESTVLFLYNPSPLSVQGNYTEMLVTVITVVTFLSVLLLLFFFFRQYAAHLRRITESMDTFDERELGLAAEPAGTAELNRLERHLARMQNRIRSLIQQEYDSKMQRMEAQQKTLLAYINPHFLYNTLNSISTMSFMEGADKSTEMILALSDMFRYSADLRETFVPLWQEIENTNHYLYIQQIRYQNDFSYQIDLPEPTKNILVPKLVLQPIVENAFLHGFSKEPHPDRKGEKQLKIQAELHPDSLLLVVQDNGAGILPADVLALQKELEQASPISPAADASGIGLAHTHHRLRLLYGSEYGLEIESIHGAYTKFIIKIGLTPRPTSQEEKIPAQPNNQKEQNQSCKNS